MKGRDGKYLVNLVFRLNEPVTPHLFARRIAEACGSHGALRPGEAVSLKGYLDTWAVLPDEGALFAPAKIEHSFRKR